MPSPNKYVHSSPISIKHLLICLVDTSLTMRPAHNLQAAAMLSQPPPRTSSQRSDSYGKAQSAAQPVRYDRPTDERYSHDYAKPQRAPSGASASYDDRRQPGRGGAHDDGYSTQAARHNSYTSSGRHDTGAPPLQGGGRTQQTSSNRPPPTPGPTDRDALWPMFRAVDKGRTGHLSEQELGAALVNGDYTSFDPHTVKMMIRFVGFACSGWSCVE